MKRVGSEYGMFVVVLIGWCLLCAPAAAQIWEEQANGGDDAGQYPPDAQFTIGQGPLSLIGGLISSPDTDMDMYCIFITDPASFSATYSESSKPLRNYALWLFDATGRPIAHARDSSFPYSVTIDDTHVPSSGQYFLAIGPQCAFPVDGANTPLFPLIVDGQTGGNPIAGSISLWGLVGCGDGGVYGVSLTGTEACLPPLVGGPSDLGPWWTYSEPDHFSQGYLFNLSMSVDPATGERCLQLNNTVEAWPFITAPASSRGSLMRIAAEDLPQYGYSEGDVLGEYWAKPAPQIFSNPSRTTVDPYGNAWITLRGDNVAPNTGFASGSVLRVGLVLGGQRTDSFGTPTPNGDYLKGPFQYCTCEDRDGDGLIRTSQGYPRFNGSPTDYVDTKFPWIGSSFTDATDECITAWTRVAGTGARFLAIDPFNDVWVGGFVGAFPNIFDKLDGTTALQTIPAHQFSGPNGYGGFVDPDNVLWISEGSGPVMWYDANARSQGTVAGSNAYGIAMNPDDCQIWSFKDNAVYEILQNGTLNASYAVTRPYGSRLGSGIVVDSGELWLGNYFQNYVTRRSAGPGADAFITLQDGLNTGISPHGVSIDRNRKVWSFNLSTNNIMRIDPNAGVNGQVDLTVHMGNGAGPYSYSDSLGRNHLNGVTPQGSWTFIHDSGTQDRKWGTLSWNWTGTAGTRVQTRVRATNNQLPSGPWTNVLDGVPFTGVVGRYMQVQVTLVRPASCDGGGEICLTDLTICAEEECFVDVSELLCIPDPMGSSSLQINAAVTNNSSLDATRVRITPMVGSSVSFSPHTIDISIPAGQTRSIQTYASGWTSNEEFCFIVTLLDKTGEECCSTEVCVVPDCDCVQIPSQADSVIWDIHSGDFIYYFAFDNLTNQTVHHVYLDPPSGVVFDPSYIQFAGGVNPGSSSGPIMIRIRNASFGQVIPFQISIHDANLIECCTRELEIMTPELDFGDPLGDPGGNWNHFAMTSINPGWVDDTLITLSITNVTDAEASFDWNAAPMAAGPGLSFALPVGSIDPPSGATPMLPPGASYDVVLQIPGGLVPPNSIAGIRASATNQSTGAPFGFTVAKVMGIPEFEMDDHMATVRVVPIKSGVQPINVGHQVLTQFEIHNDGPQTETWLWTALASDYWISLDGKEAGVPVSGSVELDPGESTLVDVYATLVQDPGTGHPVVLFRIKPDGYYPPSPYLASISYRSGGSCLVDIAAPIGVLDFFDISAFISLFTAMDPQADFTGDGSFNFFDVSEFLSIFSAGCP